MEELTIKKYCDSKNIPIATLSKITGVSASQLYNIQHDRDYDVTRETMQKIYQGTKAEFGEGLLPQVYLNII